MGDFLQGGFAALFVQFLEALEAVAGISHYATDLADIAQLPANSSMPTSARMTLCS